MQDWQDSVVRKRGSGRSFHALTTPLDLDHMKEMYDWSSRAKETAMSGNIGRGEMPKWWDARTCWLRMMAAEMRKAFNARGEERGKVLSFEELGFQLDGERSRVADHLLIRRWKLSNESVLSTEMIWWPIYTLWKGVAAKVV